MEVILVLAGLAVVWFVARTIQARGIVKRRAEQLSLVTGLPADRIADEMLSNRLTPGEWASLHGLDPMTFQPRNPS